MWKHDNFFIGITVAIALTAVTLLLLVLLVPLIYNNFSLGSPDVRLLLLAIVPPVIMMRYYMRVLRYGKSGSGALVVVFALIILWFLLIAGRVNQFPGF